MRRAARLLPEFLIGLGAVAFTAALTTYVGQQAITSTVCATVAIAIALWIAGLVLRFSPVGHRIGWLRSPRDVLLALHREYERLLSDLVAEALHPDSLDRPRYAERERDLEAKFTALMKADWEYASAGIARVSKVREDALDFHLSHTKWISVARTVVNERLAIIERLLRSPG